MLLSVLQIEYTYHVGCLITVIKVLEQIIYLCKNEVKSVVFSENVWEAVINVVDSLESLVTIFYLEKPFFCNHHLIRAWPASISYLCGYMWVLVQRVTHKKSRTEKPRVLRRDEPEWLLYPTGGSIPFRQGSGVSPGLEVHDQYLLSCLVLCDRSERNKAVLNCVPTKSQISISQFLLQQKNTER